MAQLDTDLLKEQQIIESLPLEAQGELRKYGCLENIRTAAELHDILLKFRQDYKIPPWHPFTYLMRWYANACEGNKNKPDTLWFNTKFLDPSAYDPNAEIGKQTWVYLTVHIVRGIAENVTMRFCMQPDQDPQKARLWNLMTETAIASSFVSTKKIGLPALRITRIALNRLALESLSRGELTCEATYTVRQYGRRGTQASDTAEQKKHKWRNIHRKRLRARMRETTDDEAVVEEAVVEEAVTQTAAPKLNTELIPMFEMACVKARELGMEETIKRWKQLIGLS